MKNIKEFINKTTNEGLISKQANIGLKDKIEKWVKDNCSLIYAEVEIDDQMKINVTGNQISVRWNKPELPDYIQFGKIEGGFAIAESPNLKSLRGMCESCSELILWELGITEFDHMPEQVKIINCKECHSLKSLKGLPTAHDIYIMNCNSLTDLTGAPQKVGRSFHCEWCPGLTSLKGAPQECKEFSCLGCPGLTSLEYCPQTKLEVLYCSYCTELTSLEGCPKALKKIECVSCNFPFMKPVKEIVKELYGIKVNSVRTK